MSEGPYLPTDKWDKYNLEQKIYHIVHWHQDITFSRLCRNIPECRGNYVWYYHQEKDLIICDGISLEAYDAIRKLLIEKKIFIIETKEISKLLKKKYPIPFELPIEFRRYLLPGENRLSFGVDTIEEKGD